MALSPMVAMHYGKIFLALFKLTLLNLQESGSHENFQDLSAHLLPFFLIFIKPISKLCLLILKTLILIIIDINKFNYLSRAWKFFFLFIIILFYLHNEPKNEGNPVKLFTKSI